MIKFFQIKRGLLNRSVSLDEQEIDLLVQRAMRDMADRAALGTVIVPLCFALAIIASEFYHKSPVQCLLLAIAILVGASMRGWAIRVISTYSSKIPEWILPLFGSGCLLMAAAWGLLVSLFMSVYGTDFSLILVLIISAGMAVGAVANFCIWRPIGIAYLMLLVSPGIVVGLSGGQKELYLIVAAIIIYTIFLTRQLHHWSEQFWDTICTSYKCERQAKQLANVNELLNKAVATEKEIRREVEAGRTKMRELFDNSGNGIVICDLLGGVVEYNIKALEILGVSKETMEAASFFELLANYQSAELNIAENWNQAKKGNETNFDCTQSGIDGIIKSSLQVNLRQLYVQKSAVIFASLQDMTDRKIAEEELELTRKALLKSEGYFEAILRNIEMPIYCKDIDGCYLAANRPFEVLSGLKIGEIKGKKDTEIFPTSVAEFFSHKDEEIIALQGSVELEKTISLGGIQRDLLVHKFPLRQHNGYVYGIAGICTDISTMKKALRTVQQANDAKTEFLARMSHELRTPMHSILGVARLGLKRVADGPRKKLESYFQMIVTSGDKLLELLSNLLDSSMLESPHSAYQMQAHDIGQDLQDIMYEFQAVMDEKGVRLCFESNHSPAIVYYDKVKIYQVFRNLLFNALKFSERGKTITVKLDQTDVELTANRAVAWEIEVIDQGVGIEQDEKEAIFGKFFRGSKVGKSAGGVGLGLSICKQIVMDHGGAIWAEKNNYGGATFRVLLPVFEKQEKLLPA